MFAEKIISKDGIRPKIYENFSRYLLTFFFWKIFKCGGKLRNSDVGREPCIRYSKHLTELRLPNFVQLVKTASLRGHCVLPAQTLAAGKFCLEDQGLFAACILARSHWSTRSHRCVFDSVFKNQTRKYTLTVNQNYLERNLSFL